MASKEEQFLVKLKCLKSFLERFEESETLSSTDCSVLTSLMIYFKHVILNVQDERILKSGRKVLLWQKAANASDVSVWLEYLASYPALNYTELHEDTLTVLRCLTFVPAAKDICVYSIQVLLHTLTFVEEQVRNELPLQLAFLLAKGDSEFHTVLIDSLSDSVIPMCFACRGENGPNECLLTTIPSIVTIMFEYVTDPSLHMKLLNTLMVFKRDLWKDMLTVIAYCSKATIVCVVRYLFHYWPELRYSNEMDHIVPLSATPELLHCETKSCSSKTNIIATSTLFDPALSAHYGMKNAPLYVCDACRIQIYNKNEVATFITILLQNEVTSSICENKNCFSRCNRAAVTICGSYIANELKEGLDVSLPGKRMTRYCSECFNNLARCFGDNQLLVQHSVSNANYLSRKDGMGVMVDAITSLLEERFPLPVADVQNDKIAEHSKPSRCYSRSYDTDSTASQVEESSSDIIDICNLCMACRDNVWNIKGGMQGQFGIWMLLSLHHSQENTTMTETQLNAVTKSVIHWCADMTYLPNDAYGSKIEDLKSQLMKGWLPFVSERNSEEFIKCFFPQNSSKCYSDQWVYYCPKWQSLCYGLKTILCLGSYSVINECIWMKIMPLWMDAFGSSLDGVKDENVFEELVMKLFDMDISSFPFDSKDLFQFAFKACNSPSISTQMKGLSWLSILTDIGVIIPLRIILEKFNSSILVVTEKSKVLGKHIIDELSLTYDEGNELDMTDLPFQQCLQCLSAMLEILQKQMNLQRLNENTELTPEFCFVSSSVFKLQATQLAWVLDGEHTLDASDIDIELEGDCGASSTLETILSCINDDEENNDSSRDPTIIWLWKMFDLIQQLVHPHLATIKKYAKNTGGDVSQFYPQDAIQESLMSLAILLTDLCSIVTIGAKGSPLSPMNLFVSCAGRFKRRYVILQMLNILSRSGCFLHPRNADGHREFAFKVARLWMFIPPGCYDLHSCATLILLNILRTELSDKKRRRCSDALLAASVASQTFISCLRKCLAAKEWALRYNMLDKVQCLLTGLRPDDGKSTKALSQVVSTAFCSLLNMLDDKKLEVQIKALHVFHNISVVSLKAVAGCLTIEFTSEPQLQIPILNHMRMTQYLRPEVNLFSKVYVACLDFNTGLKQQQDHSWSRDTEHLLLHHIFKHITDYALLKNSSGKKELQLVMRRILSHFQYQKKADAFQPEAFRSSVGFSTFLLDLPRMLDRTLAIDGQFVATSIAIFLCSICTKDIRSPRALIEKATLDLLPKPLQLPWITSIIVFLYKCYIANHSQLTQVSTLVTVCLNTLAAEFHQCPKKHYLKWNHLLEDADIVLDVDYAHSKMNAGCQAIEQQRECSESFSRNANYPKDHIYLHEYSSRRNQYSDGRVGKSLAQGTDSAKFHTTSLSDCSHVKEGSFSSGGDLLSQRSHPFLRFHSLDENVDNRWKDKNHEFRQGKRLKRTHFNAHSKVSTQYRRRNKSEISKKWNNISSVPLQSVISPSTCHKCNEKLSSFSSEVLESCVLLVCHFVKFNEEGAIPFLPRILSQLFYISNLLWDNNAEEKQGKISLQGPSAIISPKDTYHNLGKVTHQVILCIMQQFKNSLLITKLFLLPLADENFLQGLILCLSDFQYLNSMSVIKHAVEGLPQDLKALSCMEVDSFSKNLLVYMKSLPIEQQASQSWQQILACFGLYCSKLLTSMPDVKCDMDNLTKIMDISLKSPAPISAKQNILEIFVKLMVALCPISEFSAGMLYEICSTCHSVFTRGKGKYILMRYIVSELFSCLKLKTKFVYENMMILLQLILIDIGSCLKFSSYSEMNTKKFYIQDRCTTNLCVMECIKGYLQDCLDILEDAEYLNNIKERIKSGQYLLPDLTNYGDVKVAIAQIICCDLSQTDSRQPPLLPWVEHPPSSVQHGYKEYIDCVTHLRQLSWILIGALTHLGLFYGALPVNWQPIHVEKSPKLAHIVQVILAGLHRNSTMNDSSLLYLFCFCQLWTIYCSEISIFKSRRSGVQQSSGIGAGWEQDAPSILLMQFWSKVTFSILILLQQDNDVTNAVHHHIVAMLESLEECNSSVVSQLRHLWKVMLDRKSDQSDYYKRRIMSSSLCHDRIETAMKQVENDTAHESITALESEYHEPASKVLETAEKMMNKLKNIETRSEVDNLYIV